MSGSISIALVTVGAADNASTFNAVYSALITELNKHTGGSGYRHVATELDAPLLDDALNPVAISAGSAAMDVRLTQLAQMCSRLAGGAAGQNWATRYAAITPGTNDLATVGGAIAGRTAAATPTTVALRDVDAGMNFGHVSATGQNVARIVGSFMATPGAPGSASVFGIGVTAVGDIMLANANKNVTFGGQVNAPGFFNLSGTSQSLGATSLPGQQLEIAVGTAAAPITTATPTLKVSRYENLATPTINSEVNAVIIGYSQNTAASLAQVTGIQGTAVTNATGRADAVALVGVGRSNVDNNTGFGMYIEGQRFTRYGYARAAECRSTNYTQFDDLHTGGQVSRTGSLLLSGGGQAIAGRGGAVNADAIMITSANTRAGSVDPGWDCAINIQSGAIGTVTFDDSGTAPTSYKIGGSHIYGIDANGGVFTGAPIRLAKNHVIVARNNANTADVPLIGLQANDYVQLGGAAGATFDGAGNNNLPGQLRTGSAGVLMTDPTGHLTAAAFAPGTVPASSLSNGAVVPNGLLTVAIGALTFHNVATGTYTVYAGAASYAITVPGSGNLYHLLSVNDTGTLADTAATTAAGALLPVNNRKLALIGPLTSATTVITSALIDTTPDFRPPQSPGASGLTVTPAGVQPIATDATLNDLLSSRYISPYLPIYLGFSGTQVTLGAGGGVQHAVFINGKMRMVNSTITSVSMAGSAAGNYFVYADVGTAGVATFALTISALNSNTPNANQATVGSFYWSGTAFQSDLNTNVNSRAIIAQVQPKIVNAQNSGNIAITNVGALVAFAATGGLPFTYATSGSQTYYFNGQVLINLTGGTAACAATIQPFLNGAAAGTSYGSKTLAASNYDQIIVPMSFALAPNTVNSITVGANASVATGYTINGVYLIGTITGGV